jgi:hypothetical protein
MQRETFEHELHRFLDLAKQKPYISYWGEVYALLYQVRKNGKAQRKHIKLYDIPSGEVVYDYERDRFVAKLPDLNLILEDHELTDALMRGALVPAGRGQEREAARSG